MAGVQAKDHPNPGARTPDELTSTSRLSPQHFVCTIPMMPRLVPVMRRVEETPASDT